MEEHPGMPMKGVQFILGNRLGGACIWPNVSLSNVPPVLTDKGQSKLGNSQDVVA